jgi:sigma-B regulation protein RsbU (phosphoserine phosphatase)
VRIALQLLLKTAGFDVALADSPGAALQAVAGTSFAAALVDLNYTRDTTSGGEGLDLVGALQSRAPALPVLVMTAWGTLDLAVAAMKRGARDFIVKPWDNERLVASLETALLGTRASHDLEIARRVQGELLPRRMPALPTLDLAAGCVQAGIVGGDAFDFLTLPDGRLGIALADASGKGVAAALLMANLIGSLRAQTGLASRVSDWARAVNAQFFESTAPEHFATLFFGVYDEQSRLLRYVNCGHNPPLVLRTGGAVESLAPSAPAIGIMADWSCEERELRLASGDLLVVYSDGLVEARSAAGEELGERGLEQLLRERTALPLEALRSDIFEAVRRFAEGGDHHDDRTLILARGK